MHCDMEAQIHLLEQEAYSAVLRAFKAQSDALTWVYIFSSLHVFFVIFVFSCVEDYALILFFVFIRRRKV